MSNQNIYDNETFFEGYKTLRAGETNYNDLLEQPAMAKMLPDLTEKAYKVAEERDLKIVGKKLKAVYKKVLKD